MERMLRRLQEGLNRQPVDFDYLHFFSNHEMERVCSFENVIELPQDVVRALSDILRLLSCKRNRDLQLLPM